MSEPGAVGGAFDDSGDVGEHEMAIFPAPDHAKARDQGRERIIGDLGPRLGDGRNQRALADVGEADDADIGEQLELDPELSASPG